MDRPQTAKREAVPKERSGLSYGRNPVDFGTVAEEWELVGGVRRSSGSDEERRERPERAAAA
ncbi:hypothetical protein [Streptomyces sp. SID3343]|uniref:hypothetical protein n=1 Tax=Streptomyces sp. SID3343 TaxID=2690260 RepID=UPI00136877A2|nr:hypothetical protein [Streptomyces sp. SID3343]MYV97586.1 hypothetical protein [Streptomyces sp. SID3343]